jgi:hypothetical protein
MTPAAFPPFSDYIVFVDESGDHGMGANIGPDYPMFVLAFCAFRKEDYLSQVCPAVQRFKFRHWGHDGVVLHEHEIRKPADEMRRAPGIHQRPSADRIFPVRLAHNMLRICHNVNSD